MNNLEILLLIISISILFLLIIDIFYRKQGLNLSKNLKISAQNNILFCKLQKQYLNNCSLNDLEQLCVFLYRYYNDRKTKEIYKILQERKLKR